MVLMVDQNTMLLRIALAAGLGLLIGMERERHGRAAGLRTCMLVAMAGALVMSLSLYLTDMFGPHGAVSAVRLDPSRLPSYALAGMGFLGAGAIIQGRRSARGVTTGAAMWTCTGVGLAVGAGLYWPSLLTVALTLVALMGLRGPERLIRHHQYVTLRVEGATGIHEKIKGLLAAHHARLAFAGREHCTETDEITYTYSLDIRSGSEWDALLDEVAATPGVRCYSWQQSEVP